ncbi:MAG: hydrolase [Gemmatimonadaceae bacterium]|nr:hydrolase [Gemmatimonadaceae bacterium]
MSRSSKDTYTPAWWVPGPHAQTLWGKLVRRPPRVTTRAERWTTPDGDTLEVQRLDAPVGASPRVPRLLILHGLEGTIRSHYVRGLLDQARRRGWAADVLIFRGCNGEIPKASRFYHSGETTDLDFVVQRLTAAHPQQPLVAVGVSLGGNVLLKWLGERSDDLPSAFRAAAAVSVPYDLERGSRQLERGFSRVYAFLFLRTLRRKALAKLAVQPGLFAEERLRGARTLAEFDDAVTAPVHGFEGASDYYTRSSARYFLANIARPTLLLSAFDDPFLPAEVLDDVSMVAFNNPLLSVEFHARGGHSGFVSGLVPWRPVFFAERRVLEYLSSYVEEHARIS